MKEIDIENCWNNLSLTEKYDFIEDKHYELGICEEVYEDSFDNIEDFWGEMDSNTQLSFIIEKIQTFFPHQIACYLSNKLSLKSYFLELFKEINT